MDLQICVTPADSGAVMRVGGELDSATAPQLQEAVTGAVQAFGPRLAVDLAGLTFLDCSGIGILVKAHRELDQAGGHLRVLNPTRLVRRVIDLCGLGDHLDISNGASSVDGRQRAEPGVPDVLACSSATAQSE